MAGADDFVEISLWGRSVAPQKRMIRDIPRLLERLELRGALVTIDGEAVRGRASGTTGSSPVDDGSSAPPNGLSARHCRHHPQARCRLPACAEKQPEIAARGGRDLFRSGHRSGRARDHRRRSRARRDPPRSHPARCSVSVEMLRPGRSPTNGIRNSKRPKTLGMRQRRSRRTSAPIIPGSRDRNSRHAPGRTTRPP